MLVSDITEGATQVFSKQGGKLVKKYRCMSGPKKSRIVAKPSTCSSPIKVSKSTSLKKTKAKNPLIKIKSRRTKRINPRSKQLRRVNKTRMKPTKRSTAKRRSMK